MPRHSDIDDYIDETYHWNDNGIIKSNKALGLVMIEIIQLLEKNNKLLEKNNELLQKICDCYSAEEGENNDQHALEIP